MTRRDAQRLLDALEPGHVLSVSLGRHRGTGAIVNAVARWRGEHAFRADEPSALRDLVRAAYRSRGRELPEPAPQAALPGVR